MQENYQRCWNKARILTEEGERRGGGDDRGGYSVFDSTVDVFFFQFITIFELEMNVKRKGHSWILVQELFYAP